METYMILVYAFSFLGILDTLYLGYHTLTQRPVACPFFPPEWCSKVQYSEKSRTFGIPNSYAGLAMYSAIFVLAFMYSAGTVSFFPIQILVGIGFLFAAYFTYVQAFELKAFCTWCVVSAINFAVLAIAAFLLY